MTTDRPGAPPRFSRPLLETYSARVERLRGDLQKSDALSRSAVLRLKEIGHRPHLAGAMEERAALASVRGDPEKAARIFGAADALRQGIRVPVAPHMKGVHKEEVERLESALEKDAFESAWKEGSSLDLDAAIALATS